MKGKQTMATSSAMTMAEIEQEENRLSRIGKQGDQAARAGLPLEKAPQEALRRSIQYARRMPGLTPEQREDRAWFLYWYYGTMAEKYTDMCEGLARGAADDYEQRRQAVA